MTTAYVMAADVDFGAGAVADSAFVLPALPGIASYHAALTVPERSVEIDRVAVTLPDGRPCEVGLYAAALPVGTRVVVSLRRVGSRSVVPIALRLIAHPKCADDLLPQRLLGSEAT